MHHNIEAEKEEAMLKNKWLNYIGILVISLVLSSCATPPKIPKAIERTKVFEYSRDTIWLAILDEISNYQGQIGRFDKEAGIIEFAFIVPKVENYVVNKAPAWPVGAHLGKGSIKLTVMITGSSQEKTRISFSTWIDGEVLSLTGATINLEQMISSGTIEADFSQRLEERAKTLITRKE